MGNNKKTAAKTATKKSTKPVTTKKPAPKPAAQVEQPAEQTQEVATVANTMATIQKPTQSGLDANRRMDMITNIRIYFHDDPNAAAKYGQGMVDIMDKVAVTGLVAAVADEIQNGQSNLAAALIKQDMYPALVVAGAEMGIFLPAMNALPAPDEDGNIQIPLKEVKIDEKTQEVLNEEHKVIKDAEEGNLELDPKKCAVLGEEAVKKALTYIMVKEPKIDKHGVGETLIKIKDFIHIYDKELASKAENSKEAVNKVVNRNMHDELASAFRYVTPTFLFSKIAEGMEDLIRIERAPLSAFLVLRNLLTDKETRDVAWTDRDIADATCAIVELYENHRISKIEEELATLTDEKLIAAKKEAIEDCKKIIGYLSEFSYDICKWDPSEKLTEGFNLNVSKARGRVLLNYYNKCRDEKTVYIGLDENISQRSGIILNLFRNPGEANAAYDETNIVEIEEKPYPSEEATAETNGKETKKDLPI